MRDRRQCELRDHFTDLQHERRSVIEIQMFTRAVLEDGRRERSKRLAHFDQTVDVVAHACTAGICEDAARAERARPKLRAALEPTHDLPGRELSADCGEEVALALAEILGSNARPFEQECQVARSVLRPEIYVLQRRSTVPPPRLKSV
jgi:hypothetical protein